MADVLPPKFSESTTTPSHVPDYDFREESLPAYSDRSTSRPQAATSVRRRAQHEFSQLGKKGAPWATIRFTSSAPTAESPPLFLEGESIDGSLELDPSAHSALQRVTLTITGKIIAGFTEYEHFTFLNHSQTLWSKESDAEHMHTIPFSYKIPSSVSVSLGPNEHAESYRLPTTFIERHTRAAIQYELAVFFHMGGFFHSIETMGTKFAYVSCAKPEPASPLRQLAYQDNSPLIGPKGDAEGWKTLERIQIPGKLFKTKPVEAKFTLSLAKPLCYTRGSIIPLHLLIESPVQPDLDLFSNPTAINVSLQRATKYSGAHLAKSNAPAVWKDSVSSEATAVWWPTAEGQADPISGRRELQGEIRLPADIKPSTLIATFCVEYAIVVLPFTATAYEAPGNEHLLTEPVEIVTAFASGPRPQSFSPGKSKIAPKPYSDGRYDISIFNVHPQ